MHTHLPAESYTLLVSKANEVHLHVPDRDTLEDEAASDCAMVTALLSPAMNKQARRKGRDDRQLDGRVGDYVEGGWGQRSRHGGRDVTRG